MSKVFVKLNRSIGNTTQRHNDENEYEVVFPIKTPTGWTAPAHPQRWVFKKCLEAGEVVLINFAGGWNTLMADDIIINMYTKK